MNKQPIITLKYMKRYPATQVASKWRKKRVTICLPGRGYWLPQAKGYTMDLSKAWKMPFETALAHTASIAPGDQAIEFHLVTEPGNTL